MARAKPTPDAELTVDALARAAGTTTRNIRAYQTRGLLPPPRLQGRTGYYDVTHLARLRLISDLQSRGFSLAAIRAVLDAWTAQRGLSGVLGLEAALAAPFADERPTRISRAELLAHFPARDPERVIARAMALGLLAPLGSGRPQAFEVRSPRLLEAGAALVAAGIPVEAALDELELLREELSRVARRFVRLFEAHVWTPFVRAGMPPAELPKMVAALRRLRPIAAEAVDAVLAQAMDAATRAATQKALRSTRS